ncbi:nuclear transport factor 2 family protein [Streptacidiphilus sp. EB129]|uniref:nuclear transport factor 2 family protein n=1 Tax=Streptacidiphilus sp. EB129 TaxID=3156262 RepID=UPI00351165A5
MPSANTKPLTAESIRTLAETWYVALDRHIPLAETLPFLVDDGLEMRFPEGTSRGHAGFAEWYKAVTHRFFDEEHTVTKVEAVIDGDQATVQVLVNWQAKIWDAPAANSAWLGFDADQTWVVVAGADGPQIKTYIVNGLEPMPGSAAL